MSFWKGAKVLVTGANGFAGSTLCKKLIAEEARVYAMVRDNSSFLNLKDIIPQVNIVYADIRYPETILDSTRGMDYVFNLAAKVNIEETRKNPSETLRTNINGALNVASACKRNQVKRLVQVSTCHIYGNPPESSLPITEDTIPHPIDIYSISKYAAELFVRNIQSEGLDVVITRAFNHYGPGQIGDFFVAKVIRSLLSDATPILGSSKPTRDFSYVDDIIHGYILACQKGKNGEFYHFASGKEVSMAEMYDRVCKAVGKYPKAIWQSTRTNDMSRSFGTYDKAKECLGWTPRISLDEGLNLTVEWWISNLDLIEN